MKRRELSCSCSCRFGVVVWGIWCSGWFYWVWMWCLFWCCWGLSVVGCGCGYWCVCDVGEWWCFEGFWRFGCCGVLGVCWWFFLSWGWVVRCGGIGWCVCWWFCLCLGVDYLCCFFGVEMVVEVVLLVVWGCWW